MLEQELEPVLEPVPVQLPEPVPVQLPEPVPEQLPEPVPEQLPVPVPGEMLPGSGPAIRPCRRCECRT